MSDYPEWQFKNRSATGQIIAVQADKGQITVRLLSSSEVYTVDIPLQDFSIQGSTSSWNRSMPQKGSFAQIEFDVHNVPHCGRITTFNPGADAGMYAQVAAFARADTSTGLGFAWRDLAEGEHDLRSAGGAGYYFTADGHATIEAGASSLELDASRSEGVGSAGLWEVGGDGSEVRWGDVKRLLPGQFAETPVVPSPASSKPYPLGPGPKEWRVQVGKATPTAVLQLYLEEAGDVRGGTGGAVLQSGTGLPLRYRKTLYDSSGILPVLTIEVDAQGNIQATQEDTATLGGLVVDGGAASPLAVTFATVDVEAAVGNAKLGAKGQVQLAGGGGSASDGVTLGAALSLWLTTQLSVLTAFGPSGPAVAPLVAGTQYSATVKASV